MGGPDEDGQGESSAATGDLPKQDGEEQLSEAAASALATFRAAVAEVQYLSRAAASNPEADAEAMTAAKTKLAMAMRAATLAGVSEAVLLEASAPPEEEEEQEEATNEEAEKQEGVKEEAVKEERLRSGDSVEIFGLESEGGKLLNGQAGSISGYLEDKGRFQVTIGPDKVVSVRPENLRRRKAAPGSQSQSPEFQAGDRVEVFGLESEAARKHNGEAGKILEFQADKGRYKIALDNKEMISVKPANLNLVERGEKRSHSSSASGSGSSSSSRPAKKSKKSGAPNPEEALERMLKGETKKSERSKKSARDAGAAAAAEAAAKAAAENEPLKLGERVEVFGLRSENGKVLNGKTGLITKWDQAKARFLVDLFMGNLQSLKPDNLRRVASNSAPTSNSEPCSQFQDSYTGSTAGYTLL
eukprot:TRINITY_DN32938_c0_g1_i1.p1 TRINITY_DN32938_c0_g1~~TRINITY_DN32938_c0_g1_i1.p1  ORF type:complete len:424 (-),score=121.43 TRINITY_DN32938_c0_g1_i1:26-1273(-)